MESKKINQLATELAPVLSDLTIIGDPTTGISKKITLSQMASLFTGTVEEYPNLASFPLVGTADTIYIALDTNIIYRWNTGTSAYVELSPNIVTSLVFSDANGFDGTISLVGSTATLTITTALTQGSVPFIGTSGALTQDNANLFFDDTNNRLGINTNSPTTALDVFGSGIIGRINGTSTNNAFLGFSSAGTNKWSIGNVQSDHRFRIYSEANTSELVSVLQTGEFGIGIANPTTKLHIDGGASALIANLDANVSVAKSISFRSDNSARINLEVSGTESGSNAGANFFLRAYSDAGALLNTPLTITRATGAAAFISTISATGATFTDNVLINNSASLSKLSIKGSGSTTGLDLYVLGANATLSNQDNGSLSFQTNGTDRLSISSTGLFSYLGTGNGIPLRFQDISAAITGQTAGYIGISTSAFSGNNGDLVLYPRTSATSKILLMGGNVGIFTTTPVERLSIDGNILLDKAISSSTYSEIRARYLNDNNCQASIRFYNPDNGFGGDMRFHTQPNSNGAANAERMRITSNGHVWIGQTSTSDPVSSNIAGIAFEGALGSGKFSRSGNAALDVNRVTNDGELQRFYQDGTQEGSISVSGATVSYNSFLGSHWSQFQDGSKPEILKGTILEAIDELCVWENETNDRLPKSKISDTIESKNVYGTFFDWDNDWEGSNDFYVSSVGLGFIRVNENETIEIGNLLQSNGDGTAKVQIDDIMRSSTIAKVVSTNKIQTYEDGSYLIAATLHCG
jgi:hypothetical protein